MSEVHTRNAVAGGALRLPAGRRAIPLRVLLRKPPVHRRVLQASIALAQRARDLLLVKVTHAYLVRWIGEPEFGCAMVCVTSESALRRLLACSTWYWNTEYFALSDTDGFARSVPKGFLNRITTKGIREIAHMPEHRNSSLARAIQSHEGWREMAGPFTLNGPVT